MLDIVFPRSCAGCGRTVGEESRYLCWNCIAGIQVINTPFCAICGNPIHGSVEERYICSSCSNQLPFFDIARSAVHYTGIIRQLVQDFKYRQATWLAPDLASLMYLCLKTHLPDFRADIVTWVPLHPAKQRERSYNQSRLLAGRVATASHIHLGGNRLCRVRQTNTQTHLTATARKDNVKGVFVVRGKGPFRDKDVLLIDDVMTTGATLNDCARAIKEAGARKVAALTLARG